MDIGRVSESCSQTACSIKLQTEAAYPIGQFFSREPAHTVEIPQRCHPRSRAAIFWRFRRCYALASRIVTVSSIHPVCLQPQQCANFSE